MSYKKNSRGSVRPNKDCSNAKKNTQNKRKEDPFDKIPSFMIPRINITASGKHSMFESGGVKNKTLSGLLCGNSVIICGRNGSTKKPVYVYNKRSFVEDSSPSHKNSLLFNIKPGDYVISESHSNYEDNENHGCFSLVIFLISRSKPGSAIKIYPKPVFRYFRKFNDNSDISKYMKTGVITSSASILTDDIYKFLKNKKLEFLKDAVETAIDKSNSRETSYSYYKAARLAELDT